MDTSSPSLGDKRKSPSTTTKRKKVNHACVYCRRSHMTCDAERPCSRCVKRNIGHLCHDEVKEEKRRSPKKDNEEVPAADIAKPVAPILPNGKSEEEVMKPPVIQATTPNGATTTKPVAVSTTVKAQPLATISNPASTNGDVNFMNEFSSLYDTTLFGLQQDPFSQFASEHTNSEFLVLSDFLNIMGDPNTGVLPTSPNTNLSLQFTSVNGLPGLTDINEEGLTTEQQLALQASSAKYTRNASFPHSRAASRAPSNNASRAPSRRQSTSGTTGGKPSLASFGQGAGAIDTAQSNGPSSVDSCALQEKFFLTAADPNPDSPEERLKQVINAKVEAGLMKPFNYVRGYARLQKYMDSNMSAESRSRILAPLSTFRPAFRAIAKRLTDVDLILVEEAFERLLLDYDRVFTSMSLPACLWRRTGEIFRGNKEFAALLGLPVEHLRDGKLAITELMAEDSAVNYWEKYGNIAFDGLQKAVLTSCLLQSPDGGVVSCCFSFTIKRDRYAIPSCIVGNFLPVSF